MDGTIDPDKNYVETLAHQVGRSWPAVDAARALAIEVRELLSKTLTEQFLTFSSDDVDVVAFGSLARQEWTSGSDVDWTLLIDGQSTPDHRTLSRDIGEAISEAQFAEKPFSLPSTGGIFGNMAFSHEIVHHIGGQADTNRNTTQRILMLLEAFPIRHQGHQGKLGAYERVARNILFRYLHDDTNFYPAGNGSSRIPRFLLNDVVRYWRTMCVDFAYKEWEQAGAKWALRNVKLRMSRKMLFVSSLLTIFSCFRNPDLKIEGGKPTHYTPMMQDHLMRFVQSTPMNIVVWTLMNLGLTEQAGRIVDQYDQFLQRLNEEDVRSHLRDVPPQNIYQDETFLQLRDISHQFQGVLSDVFFCADTDLKDFTSTYGVF